MRTKRDNFYYEGKVQNAERGDDRNNEQVRRLLKKHFKIITAGVILIVIVLILAGKYIYDDYQASQVQHDYYESFFDGFATAAVLPLASFEIAESTKSNETLNQLLTDYREILIVALQTEEFPKKQLKRYNDSIRQILGKEAEEFLVDERWNFDCDGFLDGMTYYGYCYAIEVAYDSGTISKEEFAEFEKRDKALLEDLSHENVMEILPYILELLEKGWDEAPKSDMMYYDL